jgi:transposase
LEVDAMTEPIATLFVGVDWSTQEHQIHLSDSQGGVLKEFSIEHGPQELDDLCELLLGYVSTPAEVWIAIEVPRGPLVETLLERGFSVFSINPKQVDAFRSRFSVAGAKDDRFDAQVMASSLRTDPGCYRRLEVDDPQVIKIREWSRIDSDLQEDRSRDTNRLRDQLRRYYKAMLDLDEDLSSNWFLELWLAAPTPEAGRSISPQEVGEILKRCRIRKITVDEVVDILRQQPLIVAPGTVEAASDHIRILVERLQVTNEQIRKTRKLLDKLCESFTSQSDRTPQEGGKYRDVEILLSIPGLGRIVLATLLAEASQPLKERDYHVLRSLAGVAPVTRQSGHLPSKKGTRKKQRKTVKRRYACSRRLANAMYHWGRVASQRDAHYKSQYARLRAKGHTHGRAVRGIGDRLLSVAMAMLRDGTLYDPDHVRQTA